MIAADVRPGMWVAVDGVEGEIAAVFHGDLMAVRFTCGCDVTLLPDEEVERFDCAAGEQCTAGDVWGEPCTCERGGA